MMDLRTKVLVLRMSAVMAVAMGCGTADRRNEAMGFDAQVDFDTKVDSETKVDSKTVDSVVVTDSNKEVVTDSSMETNGNSKTDTNADSAPDSSVAVDLPGQMNADTDTKVTGPLLPPHGAVGTCADVTLGILLESPPVLKGTGKLQLHDGSGAVVESFSKALPVARTVAGKAYNVNPIQIIGNGIYFLPTKPLKYGETYSVTVDEGMIADDQGNPFSVSADKWRFTVRASKPTVGNSLTVAADGNGDYCTLQGALDSIPKDHASQVTLKIKNGVYPGLVVIEKSNVIFQGSDRFKTILANRNSGIMSVENIKSSRMAYLVEANDITFDNLTLWNTYPQESKEPETRWAESLTVEKDSKRIFLNQVELKSHQDTLMIDQGAQVYIKDSRIFGDIDFVWGSGSLYCENCELTSTASGHSITQARTAAGTNGFAFVNCKLTRNDRSIEKTTLGRRMGFMEGNVAYINCQMDEHIIGWSDTSNRSWEYGNTRIADGAALKFTGEQLATGEAKLAATTSALNWLGWSPI
jgi:pectin methylesterase-like acyl-CoA thioesterase